MRRVLAITTAVVALAAAAPAAAKHKRVVFGGDVAGSFRARPGKIHLTSDENLESIRWSSWGGKTAKGSGTAVFSAADKLPPAPVTLALSHKSRCGKRLQYLKLDVTYLSGAPPGSSSTFSVRYTCKSPR